MTKDPQLVLTTFCELGCPAQIPFMGLVPSYTSCLEGWLIVAHSCPFSRELFMANEEVLRNTWEVTHTLQPFNPPPESVANG